MIVIPGNEVRSFIPARDFALCQRFYAALGWATSEVARGLALVKLSERQHFYLQDYYLREVAENSMLHISVDDVDGCYQRLLGLLHGGAFPGARVQAPTTQPYGASVCFVHDPSGVLLHLCQWDG